MAARESLRQPLAAALALLCCGALVGVSVRSAAAEETAAAEEPTVSLEQLLTLPKGYGEGDEKRGGASASEWRRRFSEARADVDKARRQVEQTQAQLETMAGESDQWQMSAPGATNPENSPLSYKMREDLRRQRDGVNRAERGLRDLEVEANLAGVPDQWRRAEPERQSER